MKRIQNKSQLSLLFFFLLIACGLSAQSGSVRGYVYDKDTGEPIVYCNVVLEGTTMGTNSDFNGFFNFSGVPVGDYILSVTYLGFDTVRSEIILRENKIVTRNIYLAESSVKLGVIDISAKREQSRTEVQISKLQVSQKKIKALPSTGGDADLLQYLQVLPGIISTGDQGGQLFIRGGSPVQNKILLDGLTIYNPFHSIGFYSTFDTEMIRNVDVFTGGFNAEHGGRISAIIDVHTREANKTRVAGQLSASPFMAKARVEVPIKKFKEGSGSTSFVLSTKRSLIQETSKSLYKYASEPDSIGLPFSFTDTYGKLSLVSGNGSKFHFFGFNYDDQYNNPNIANIGWNNVGGGTNFTLIPSSSSMILSGLIGYSGYNVAINDDTSDARQSKINEITAGLNMTNFGSNSEFNYGIDFKSIATEFEFVNPFKQTLDQNQNTFEVATFLKIRTVIADKLVFEPGFRFQFYASQSVPSLEPRLGFKYNVTDNIRIKGAGGYYSQNLLSSSNERDVVNLFSGFLSGPESQVPGVDGEPLENKIQTARHAIGGFEIDLMAGMELNVEGYYKKFDQLITVNRNRLSAADPSYVSEIGDAYGVDISMNYSQPKYNIWATYSIGKVTRFDGEQEYPTIFDRRHNVNFLATYDVDEAGDFQVSLRWNMGSGFPFTKTQGFYNYNSFFDGVGTDVLTENPEEVGVIYSDERNGGRLPYYHRLDISATKFFNFSEHTNLEVVASVSNAYNRENIFYFDRIKYDRVNQLPIIPSMAVKFNF